MHIVEFFGRLLLSALFLIEGLGKISIQEDVIMYMEDYGVPGILFLPALVLEILFPLLLIVGYKTKWTASIMALFTFTVAIIFHTKKCLRWLGPCVSAWSLNSFTVTPPTMSQKPASP